MVADDRTDDRGLAVTGLPGLKFDSRLGMAYELNTTGQSMSLSIPTPLGNQNHTFVDGQLDRLKGQGEFHVDGNVGQVFNTDGIFTITDADGELAINVVDSAVTVYAGPLKVAIVHSATVSGYLFCIDSFDHPITDPSCQEWGWTRIIAVHTRGAADSERSWRNCWIWAATSQSPKWTLAEIFSPSRTTRVVRRTFK